MSVNWYSLQPAQQQAILDGPALPPPPGILSNFDDPANMNSLTLAVISAAVVLGTLAVLIRVYAKVISARRARLEDYLGLIAFAAYVAHAWSVIALTKRPGMFVHQWDVHFRDEMYWAQILNLLRAFYFLTLGFGKVAILLEWTRIFVPQPDRNLFFWLCHVMIATNVALYVATIPITFLICIPPEASWNPFIPGKCINRWAADISTFTFHLVTDILTFLLPQRVIFSLNMPMSQRVGVSLVFSLGLLTCICAAARVYSIATIDYYGDVVYKVSAIILWGIAETTAILLVFCAPAAPKAFLGDRGLVTLLSRPLQSLIHKPSGSDASRSLEHSNSSRKPKQIKGFYSQLEERDAMQLQTINAEDHQAAQETGNNQATGIMKTTNLLVQEETVANAKGQWLDQQHSWMREHK
ncbi:hypothetical protein E0Z10_g10142 [Xylaria hypoxylon]|uniref:Rhodopsin domain-containing protein n=1 Tax=Xylaria hypoxylon TaxID=37992 RepID=A0A4Z0YPU8_9PEZI|nr:hypothetical protein E0Z10_g10142 [Xylaria hypoxylon]